MKLSVNVEDSRVNGCMRNEVFRWGILTASDGELVSEQLHGEITHGGLEGSKLGHCE